MASSSTPEVRGERLNRWVRRSRWGLVVLAAGLGVLEVTSGMGWWKLDPWVIPAARYALIASTLAESTWGLSRVKARERTNARELELDKQCVSLLVTLARVAQIEVDVAGCNVWSKQYSRRHGTYLWREHRRRLSNYPQPSEVLWTEGKGVIGRCLKEGEDVYQSWRPAQRQWADTEEISATQWRDVSERERWGFGRAEYLRSIRKYSEILAMPIKDRHGRVLGVLSVDIPADRAPADDSLCLKSGDVRSIVSTAADSLRALL